MNRKLLCISTFALALLSGSALADNNASFDCSTTITTGGTAQFICGSTKPPSGFAIYNPDQSGDLWVSDSMIATPNREGSIRVPANGGGYETPPGYKPLGPISIYGATTGQPITAKRW